MVKNKLLQRILKLKWKEVPGQCRKLHNTDLHVLYFFNCSFLNEAANETNYTVFRVECLSYNAEFWKLCGMKWRCSVTEVNGKKLCGMKCRCSVTEVNGKKLCGMKCRCSVTEVNGKKLCGMKWRCSVTEVNGKKLCGMKCRCP